MAFQTFLDANNVKDIDPVFGEVMDAVAEPIVRASYSVPSSILSVLPPVLVPAVPIALAAKQGQGPEVAGGASILMAQIVVDITTFIITPLNAGALSLAKVPPVGVVAPPIASLTAMMAISPIPPPTSPQAILVKRNFAKATLEWAVSLLSPVDLRLLNTFVVI